MKIYYLKDKDNYIYAKFELEVEDRFQGKAYECVSRDMNNNPIDWLFQCEVYAKWDGCSHWWFYGEEYPKESDSYYHICSSFQTFIRIMCFVWKIAGEYHIKDLKARNCNTDMTLEEYNLEMVDYFLKDFIIELFEESK